MSEPIVLVMVALVAILVVKWFVSQNQQVAKGYRYCQSTPLFSAAERSFLGVLDLAVAQQYRVFGKVRVADILLPAKGLNRSHWRIAFNKIAAKHFDYVLCDKETLAVIAMIELDDNCSDQPLAIGACRLQNRTCDGLTA